MPVVSLPTGAARAGLKIATNQLTTIQIRLASVELLVGGPYGDHRYGHTVVRVSTDKLDKVSDYGGYRNSWGFGNSEGEGIPNIWNDFNAYIHEENSLERVTTGVVYEKCQLIYRRCLKAHPQKNQERSTSMEQTDESVSMRRFRTDTRIDIRCWYDFPNLWTARDEKNDLS